MQLSTLSAVLLLFLSLPAWSQGPWPGGGSVEVGRQGQPGFLPAGFEPSGAVWHPRRESLILVSDGGQVAELVPGVGVTLWTLPGDLEAVTIVDPDTDVVHVGVENPDGVVTFDLATGTAGQSWDLTPWMSGPANQGLEGLAHVDGVFWAGLQDTGELFRFRLLPNGSVQLLGSQPSRAGRRDISGLHYDASTGVLYAIHDTFDVIVEYEPPGTFAREYSLPADNQEGIALVGAIATQSGVFVAQDNGPVLEYSSYPIEPRGVFEIVNGSGINPVCFTSSAPIAIGSVWASQISAAGHPGATTGAILVSRFPAHGIFLPIGELLLDPHQPLLFVDAAPIQGGTAQHGISVPAITSLVGTQVYLQGLTLAGTPRLCNRIDAVVGV